MKTKNLDNIKDKSRAYRQEEIKCPLCKNPANCVIPNFPDIDNEIQSLEDPEDKDIDIEAILKNNGDEFILNENENSKKMFEIYKKFTQEIDTFVNKLSIMYTFYCDLSRTAALRVEKSIARPEKKIEDFEVNRSIAEALGYICRISSMIGLPKFVKERLPTYALLFKALRLNIMKEAHLKGFKGDYESAVKLNLEKSAKKLKSILSSEENFLNCDIQELAFENLVNLVKFFCNVF